MKILVVGAQGQLGRSLAAAAAGTKGLALVAVGRPTLDLLDRDSLARAVDAADPSLVVNAAAYTAVDRAEHERDLAYAINCDGAGVLAEVTAERGTPLVHISTDYVFDGRNRHPYREADLPNPQTVYGLSKLLGEERVAFANPQHLILRTSWVYSPFGHNFVKTILRLATEQPELKVVADQHGNPTFAGDLAMAILGVARRLSCDGTNFWGLYHIAGEGSTTWHGLAEFIVAAAARHGRSAVPVHAISTSEFPTTAQRPTNSRLDCGKLAAVFGLRLAPWTDGVVRCVTQLCGQTGSAGVKNSEA